MRLRNVPGAREEMLVNPYVIQNPQKFRGSFHTVFGNQNPLQIEIGMGKGQFLTKMAMDHPDINYIGIEKYSSVLIRAIEKQEEMELPNLKFIRMDAEGITEVFAPEEVDRIYLNFSDPWPKDRHAKRRLTSQTFLRRYSAILKEKGIVEFKTDNQDLFSFSLVSVAEEAGWELLYFTRDLHSSSYAEGNIMTEYEERFSKQGTPICKLEIMRK